MEVTKLNDLQGTQTILGGCLVHKMGISVLCFPPRLFLGQNEITAVAEIY